MNPYHLDEAEQADLYGPWVARTPEDAAKLFKGYPGIWWISGGWGLEAFTGVTRKHVDVDLSVLRSELTMLRQQFALQQHLWIPAHEGALFPLVPEDRLHASADEVLPEGASGLWTRRNARQPWEFDIALAPGSHDEWVSKHNPDLRRPMKEAIWEKDGIHYLEPEIILLTKSGMMRDRDQLDFDNALPLLGDERREWLREAIRNTRGEGHPWLEALAA